MTEPSYTPSEQEIEAAASPVAEALYSNYWSAAGHDPEDCKLSNAAAQVVENWMQDARPIARAALTAAAHVRSVNISGAQVEAALRELGMQQPSVDDVARVSRAISAAVSAP